MFDASDWSTHVISNHSKQKPSDSVNCGVFVAQFLKRLCCSELDLNFKANTKDALNEIRRAMSQELKEFEN